MQRIIRLTLILTLIICVLTACNKKDWDACPECSESIDLAEYAFCPHCGNSLSEQDDEQDDTDRENKEKQNEEKIEIRKHQRDICPECSAVIDQ